MHNINSQSLIERFKHLQVFKLGDHMISNGRIYVLGDPSHMGPLSSEVYQSVQPADFELPIFNANDAVFVAPEYSDHINALRKKCPAILIDLSGKSDDTDIVTVEDINTFHQQWCSLKAELPKMNPQPTRPGLFLDRDGTVIKHIAYLKDPAKVELEESILPFIQHANKNQIPVIVITNQSGLARDYFELDDYYRVNTQMRQLLAKSGLFLDEVLYSSYYPESSQLAPHFAPHDRKPGTGLVIQAARRQFIDLSRSVFIGDRCSDLECGYNAGIPKRVLIENPAFPESKQNLNSKKISFFTIQHISAEEIFNEEDK